MFCLIKNRDGFLQFISEIKNKLTTSRYHIYFDFSNVNEISHGAITIFLSTIGWLNDNGVSVSGNFPIDLKAKRYFQESGFLDFFKTIGKRDYEKGKNTIVARGQSKSNAELTAKLIREAMETIQKVRKKNMKVQGMLVELMANTVNHAYIDTPAQKGWYFSLEHNQEEEKVKFCFVDNGSGILSTLEKKLGQKIKEKFGGVPAETLRKAFSGVYGSRTKLSNRGRGLKAIKKVADTHYIKNLKVITDEFEFDFEENKINSISAQFDGTFYFWEIDKTCVYDSQSN